MFTPAASRVLTQLRAWRASRPLVVPLGCHGLAGRGLRGFCRLPSSLPRLLLLLLRGQRRAAPSLRQVRRRRRRAPAPPGARRLEWASPDVGARNCPSRTVESTADRRRAASRSPPAPPGHACVASRCRCHGTIDGLRDRCADAPGSADRQRRGDVPGSPGPASVSSEASADLPQLTRERHRLIAGREHLRAHIAERRRDAVRSARPPSAPARRAPWPLRSRRSMPMVTKACFFSWSVSCVVVLPRRVGVDVLRLGHLAA